MKEAVTACSRQLRVVRGDCSGAGDSVVRCPRAGPTGAGAGIGKGRETQRGCSESVGLIDAGAAFASRSFV